MDLPKVSEHLNLLSSLNSKQRFDILFNLGHVYKDFKELLGLTHSSTTRNRLEKLKSLGLVSLGEPKTGSLKFRLADLLTGRQVTLNSHEQHIVFTLVESPYITNSLRSKLKESLNYVLEAPKEVTTYPCAICSYASTGSICLSCKRNIIAFTNSRRESFTVPINYLNFNIRGTINLEGAFDFDYKDWSICKYNDKIVYTLLPKLLEGTEPIQYDLPFVENQRTIS